MKDYLLIELDDAGPNRQLDVPDRRRRIPAAAYKVLEGIEAEEIVSDQTVRWMMQVAGNLSNTERPIDYMFAYVGAADQQQSRIIAGKLHRHHMDRAREQLREGPGILGVQPAEGLIMPARWRPVVFPPKQTERFAASLYGGRLPDEDAERRLAVERFLNENRLSLEQPLRADPRHAQGLGRIAKLHS